MAICLQEAYLKNKNITVKNYTLYNLYATIENRKPSGGVSILIRNNVTHEEVHLNTNIQAKAITVTAEKKLHFAPSICHHKGR